MEHTNFLGLFADDTAVAAKDVNNETAVQKLQGAVDKIYVSVCKWKIALNYSKYVRVDYALRHHNYTPTIIGNQTIPLASAACYLGLHLDSKLNWAEHVIQKYKWVNISIAHIFM